MLNTKFIDELTGKIGEAIRSSPARDIERNVRATLGAVFNKLDLVTRDEFEVQAQLLLRTRERLDQLDDKLRELEAQRTAGSPPAANAEAGSPTAPA